MDPADTLVLYFGAAKDPEHIRGALEYVSSPSYWKQINIEEESYIPLTLFRYGRNEVAYQVLANISDPGKPRREYPEISYSVIEAIISGVMGVTTGTHSDGYDVSTLSRLPSNSDRATLTAVTLKQNQIDVSHNGLFSTRFSNQEGPSLRWRAEFPGTFLHLNVAGKVVPAKHALTWEGAVISWTNVNVEPGAEISVVASPSRAVRR